MKSFIYLVWVAAFALLGITIVQNERRDDQSSVASLKSEIKALREEINAVKAIASNNKSTLAATVTRLNDTRKKVQRVSVGRVAFKRADLRHADVHSAYKMLNAGFHVSNYQVEDANGNKHLLVIPGLDEGRDDIAAWAINVENAFSN